MHAIIRGRTEPIYLVPSGGAKSAISIAIFGNIIFIQVRRNMWSGKIVNSFPTALLVFFPLSLSLSLCPGSGNLKEGEWPLLSRPLGNQLRREKPTAASFSFIIYLPLCFILWFVIFLRFLREPADVAIRTMIFLVYVISALVSE